MAQDYSPQITRVGLAKLTNASLLGQQLMLSHMAVGDGGSSTVNLDATQLEHEVYRAPINEIRLDDNAADRVLAVLVIPIDVGGFNITELGLFDSDGELIAVSRFPATYKPTLDEGTGREISVRMKLQLSNVDVIKLQVDPTAVLATKQEVIDHNADPEAHPEMQQHIEDTNDPHGTIPDGGETGQVLIKQADGGIAWGAIAGVPVGELCFSTNGVALPGTIPVNVKQKVLCSAFPQLFEWMKGGTYLTDETAWDAEAAAQDGSCGKYCWDGGDYFILPCYTRYFAAAHGDKAAGSWDGDAIRDIVGLLSDLPVEGVPSNSSGAFAALNVNPSYDIANDATSGDYRTDFEFKASRVVPTAEENRPKTSYVLPCIKAFDVPINTAHVDMLALAEQVAAINGNKVDRSEWVELVPGKAWKRPDGLIEQVGAVVQANAGLTICEVVYPVAFEQVYHADANCQEQHSFFGSLRAEGVEVNAFDPQKLLIRAYLPNTSSAYKLRFNWRAIGR